MSGFRFSTVPSNLACKFVGKVCCFRIGGMAPLCGYAPAPGALLINAGVMSCAVRGDLQSDWPNSVQYSDPSAACHSGGSGGGRQCGDCCQQHLQRLVSAGVRHGAAAIVLQQRQAAVQGVCLTAVGSCSAQRTLRASLSARRRCCGVLRGFCVARMIALQPRCIAVRKPIVSETLGSREDGS